MKIWCLFSIENNYDQPSNNLVAWWTNKPSIQCIAKALDIAFDPTNGSAICGKILKGEEVRWQNTDYRLEEINEGVL